jgi:hypothetical protein
MELVRRPRRSGPVLASLMLSPAPYRLLFWVAANAVRDLVAAPLRLLPSSILARFRALPAPLRAHARYAERELRRVRWRYLRLSLAFQLELTGAQIPLQRLGQQIEWLVSILALCHHAAVQDATQWRIAELQCVLLRERVEASKPTLASRALRRLRRAVAAVGRDVADDRTSLFADLAPEPYAHPFTEPKG